VEHRGWHGLQRRREVVCGLIEYRLITKVSHNVLNDLINKEWKTKLVGTTSSGQVPGILWEIQSQGKKKENELSKENLILEKPVILMFS
jgi:hypothetical protein